METTVITCKCSVCNGASARIRGAGTVAGRKVTPTAIHNLVRLALSPLGNGPQGPWRV